LQAEAIGKACIKDLQTFTAEEAKLNKLGNKLVMPHLLAIAKLAVKAAGNTMIGAQAYFVALCGSAERAILKESRDTLMKPEYGFTEKTIRDAQVRHLFPSWDAYKSQVKAGFVANGSGDDIDPAIDPREFSEKEGEKFGQAIREHYAERRRGARAGENQQSDSGQKWPDDFIADWTVLNTHVKQFTPEALSKDVAPLIRELNAKLAAMLAPVAKTDASKGTTGPGAAKGESSVPRRQAA
jgi:hypothetical protein